ncbi:MAG: hypothetical protein E7639_05125 [Ruminococcaceae bacterium]|nr:hypothetical protein [Oscillospiraceae bacterium]
MNRKHENADIGMEQSEYTPHRSHVSLVVAGLICLVLALLIWLLVMNADSTAYVALELTGGDSAYTYVLSDTELEVSGAVYFLKKAENIQVTVPANATESGTYEIQLVDLVIPEGVALTEELSLTLTVTQE